LISTTGYNLSYTKVQIQLNKMSIKFTLQPKNTVKAVATKKKA